MSDLPPAIPAATLVIFRDRADGPPDLLMVERAKAMTFAGGALVFPGGRVDPGDRALAQTLGGDGQGSADAKRRWNAVGGGDTDEDAHRIAAIRETVEEVGLAIGLHLPPDALDLLRSALHDGAAIGPAMERAGARLDLDALVPFARWRPAHAHMRIFDTRFYLARLPDGAPAPSVDATENTCLFWASAAQVLADCDAGRATIIYPTRRNLERLAQFGSFAEAAAHARALPVRTITPVVEEREDGPHLCIPADLGYPVTSEPMGRAMRG